MTDMIEQVARVAGITPEQATLAIKAMRDPTPEILEAMKTNIGPLKEMWRGGIDAALEKMG